MLNNLICWSLEQRKVYWRAMHGDWVTKVKKTP